MLLFPMGHSTPFNFLKQSEFSDSIIALLLFFAIVDDFLWGTSCIILVEEATLGLLVLRVDLHGILLFVKLFKNIGTNSLLSRSISATSRHIDLDLLA